MRIEPWVEEEARQMQMEVEYERWLADRPVCPICGEHIGAEDLIDFTDGLMYDGYVYHTDCLYNALKFGKLNSTRGEELFDLINDKHGRRA